MPNNDDMFERMVIAAAADESPPPTPSTRAELNVLIRHGFFHLARAGPHQTANGELTPAIGTQAEQMRIAMNRDRGRQWMAEKRLLNRGRKRRR